MFIYFSQLSSTALLRVLPCYCLSMEDIEPARIQTEIKSAQKFSRNNKAKGVNYANEEQDMVT